MPSIGALLTEPESFFRERRNSPSLKGPIAVVTAVALLGAVGAVIQFRAMSAIFSDLGGEAGAFAGAFQAVGIVIALVTPFIFWVLYAGLFHGISIIFDGKGPFTTTLALVGWGFVPNVVSSLFTVLLNFYRFNVRGVAPADVTQESMQQFQQQVQSGPLVALAGVVGLVFTLWSGLLWAFAMKHARTLSMREAVLTVVLPVLVGVGFSLFSIVNAL